jgi:hypothetical protein
MNRCVAWLLFLCIALPVAAQTRTTKKIVVKLAGDCGSVPGLSMVLRGNELLMLKLWPAGNLWTADSESSFDAATATASLRFHPGRTACLRALPEKDDESGNPIAKFVFRCGGGDYRRIAIDLGESVPVAYRRDVARSTIATDSVACIETGTFEFGKGTVTDVETNREKVFIYPGFTTADSRWDGILVSDLPATARPVTRNLSRAELSDLFFRQVARGVGSSPPVLSDNGRLRVRITLEKRGVNDVSISVQR